MKKKINEKQILNTINEFNRHLSYNYKKILNEDDSINNELSNNEEPTTDVPKVTPPVVDGIEPEVEIQPTESEVGDVEVDVTDIIDKQEEALIKIDTIKLSFDNGFENITQQFINLQNQIKDVIDNSNYNNEKLEQELIKRNPTSVEKLELRSKNSYPFNQTPEDYWNEKEESGNYQVVNNDNQEDEYTSKPKEYVLTQDEVDNEPIINDYQMAKTFNQPESMDNIFSDFLNKR